MISMQNVSKFDRVETAQIVSLSDSIRKHLCKMQYENSQAKFACAIIEILKEDTLRMLLACISMKYCKEQLYGHSFENAIMQHHRDPIEISNIKILLTNAALLPNQQENRLFPHGYLTTVSQELMKTYTLKLGNKNFVHFIILVCSTCFKIHASIFPLQTTQSNNIPLLALDLIHPQEYEAIKMFKI